MKEAITIGESILSFSLDIPTYILVQRLDMYRQTAGGCYFSRPGKSSFGAALKALRRILSYGFSLRQPFGSVALETGTASSESLKGVSRSGASIMTRVIRGRRLGSGPSSLKPNVPSGRMNKIQLLVPQYEQRQKHQSPRGMASV